MSFEGSRGVLRPPGDIYIPLVPLKSYIGPYSLTIRLHDCVPNLVQIAEGWRGDAYMLGRHHQRSSVWDCLICTVSFVFKPSWQLQIFAWTVDVAVNFLTGIYVDGELVMKPTSEEMLPERLDLATHQVVGAAAWQQSLQGFCCLASTEQLTMGSQFKSTAALSSVESKLLCSLSSPSHACNAK